MYMYLRTSLYRLVSWLSATMHHWTTCLAETSRSAKWSILYLQSARFIHAPAPSCSPFPWSVSNKFQQCLIQVFIWIRHIKRMTVKIWIDLHIHLIISSVHWILFHEFSMSHKSYQNNVVQNVYHDVYDHH